MPRYRWADQTGNTQRERGTEPQALNYMKHQIRSYVQHGEAGRRNKSSMACDKGHPLILLLECECIRLVALHPGLGDAH